MEPTLEQLQQINALIKDVFPEVGAFNVNNIGVASILFSKQSQLATLIGRVNEEVKPR